MPDKTPCAICGADRHESCVSPLTRQTMSVKHNDALYLTIFEPIQYKVQPRSEAK